MILKINNIGKYNIKKLSVEGKAWVFDVIKGTTVSKIKTTQTYKWKGRVIRNVIRETVPVDGVRYHCLALRIGGRYITEDDTHVYFIVDSDEIDALMGAGFNVNSDGILALSKDEIIDVVGGGCF